MNSVRNVLAGAVLCGLATTQATRAEVSAEVSSAGAYLRTVILANESVKNLRVWSVARSRTGLVPLNPAGDSSGDLWPVFRESPTLDRWPWVVWSHFNGSDFDLVWSRWSETGWTPTAPVEGLHDVDAIDPDLTFDLDGRAHTVWVSVDGVSSSVYLSRYLATIWMDPYLISDPAEIASNPSVIVMPDGGIHVSYDTPAGRVTRVIRFVQTDTITDDITPFNTLSLESTTLSPNP